MLSAAASRAYETQNPQAAAINNNIIFPFPKGIPVFYSPTLILIPSEYALNSGAYWHWIKA